MRTVPDAVADLPTTEAGAADLLAVLVKRSDPPLWAAGDQGPDRPVITESDLLWPSAERDHDRLSVRAHDV
jgi:hypothetical protein